MHVMKIGNVRQDWKDRQVSDQGCSEEFRFYSTCFPLEATKSFKEGIGVMIIMRSN